MIQQLRPQFASLTPSAKPAEDPAIASDFTDWMADDSKGALDQEASLPDTAVLFSVPQSAPSQSVTPQSAPPPVDPGADVPMSALTAPPPLAAWAGGLPTAATQLDPHGQIQFDLPGTATAEQHSRAPADSKPQPGPSLGDTSVKRQDAPQNTDKADGVSEIPASSPRTDGAGGKIKPVSGQATESMLASKDKNPPLQMDFTQDQPPILQAAASLPSLEQPSVEAAAQVPQAALSAPVRAEAAATQFRQTEEKSARRPEAAGAPRLAASAMPVRVQLLAAGPPEPKHLPAPQPALRSLGGELSNIGQGAGQPDQDISAPRPEGVPSLPPPRPTERAAEPQRQHLTPPPNLHSQLLAHASTAIDRQVEVLLTPEDLGSVRFQIRHHGETVSILLSAERGDTMDMLRRHGDELMREFRQAGFSGATLDFGRWGQQQQSQQQAPANFALADDFATLPLLPRPSLAAQTTGDVRGLNLRL